MKRLLLALAALAALASPAATQTRVFITPLGYCQLTATGTAALVSTCSGGIPARTVWAVICVETANIRYRDDATNPTASVGIPVLAGQCMGYRSRFSALAIIAQSGSPVVNISFYDGVGE